MNYTPPNITDKTGCINSVYPCTEYLTFGYWIYCVPQYKPKNVLLLGVAGGTIAGLIQKIWGDVPITGVDIDECPNYYNINLIKADAREYIKTCEHYDCVIVDLYNDEENDICKFTTEKEFAEDIKKIGDYLIFNASSTTDMKVYGKPLRVLSIDSSRIYYYMNNRVQGLLIR